MEQETHALDAATIGEVLADRKTRSVIVSREVRVDGFQTTIETFQLTFFIFTAAQAATLNEPVTGQAPLLGGLRIHRLSGNNQKYQDDLGGITFREDAGVETIAGLIEVVRDIIVQGFDPRTIRAALSMSSEQLSQAFWLKNRLSPNPV